MSTEDEETPSQFAQQCDFEQWAHERGLPMHTERTKSGAHKYAWHVEHAHAAWNAAHERTALRWQTEPPTEPVERCLVRLGDLEFVAQFRIIHGRMHMKLSDERAVPIEALAPGTQYCPLPDIAEWD